MRRIRCYCYRAALLCAAVLVSTKKAVVVEAFGATVVAPTNREPACGFQKTRQSFAAASAANSDSISDEDEWPLPEPVWACPQPHDDANVCEQTGVTLNRYMMEMARANHPELDDVESIMTALQTACKTISSLVRRAAVDGLLGQGDTSNIHGEHQKKLDVVTNQVLKTALSWSGKLATLASEEEDVPVLLDNFGNQVYSGDIVVEESGSYVAVFDPLDGSSNVDASIPTGTIFGIFKRNDDSDDECGILDTTTTTSDYGGSMDEFERQCLQDTLQPGKNLVAAGYCLYSSATMLVLTIGNGVMGFTLDESIGEFRLTHPHMKIPVRGTVYSFNESNRRDWDVPLQQYIDNIQTGQRYTARYIGSMVADVHRTLLYGGIFGYPADKKNPNGKLRLLYEAAPMAFVVEQAGGLAVTGHNHRILDLEPQSVHQRVPCILGSPADVTELRRYYDASDDPALLARCQARLTRSSFTTKSSTSGSGVEVFTSSSSSSTTTTVTEIHREWEDVD